MLSVSLVEPGSQPCLVADMATPAIPELLLCAWATPPSKMVAVTPAIKEIVRMVEVLRLDMINISFKLMKVIPLEALRGVIRLPCH